MCNISHSVINVTEIHILTVYFNIFAFNIIHRMLKNIKKSIYLQIMIQTQVL
jgi:hypothetical protein